MAAIADRWAQTIETAKVVEDATHPHFMKAGQFAAEQVHGRASQVVELQGNADAPLVVRYITVTKTKD